MPLFSLLRTDGACFCGAPSIFAVYATPEEVSAATAAFNAEHGDNQYRMTWLDTQGFGLNMTVLHSHLNQRPTA